MHDDYRGNRHHELLDFVTIKLHPHKLLGVPSHDIVTPFQMCTLLLIVIMPSDRGIVPRHVSVLSKTSLANIDS